MNATPVNEKEIIAQISDRVTVEHWPLQTYWKWVVADEYCNRARQIRAYSSRSNALRAGRNLSAKLQAEQRP